MYIFLDEIHRAMAPIFFFMLLNDSFSCYKNLLFIGSLNEPPL